MASLEIQLISSLIQSQTIDKLLEKGITEDSFSSDLTTSTIFRYLLNYKTKYGKLPSLDMIKSKFENFELAATDEPVEALCDALIELNLKKEMGKVVEEFAEKISYSPSSALSFLISEIPRLSRIQKSANDLYLEEYLTECLKGDYDIFKNRKGLIGYPFPWPALNEATGGILPQQLIVLYGSAKSCKTWLLLHIAVNIYEKAAKKVLIATKEMSPALIAKRCAALLGKLPYRDFGLGNLSPEDEDKIEVLSKKPRTDKDIVISDARSDEGEVSVPSIMAKAESINPDIILIDGTYLLTDSRTKQKIADHKQVTHITQDLKDMAQRLNKPVIITTQANRYGDRASKDKAIGYSVSFIQDADVLLSIFRKAKEKEIAIKIDALREGEETGFIINAKVASDFSQKFNYIDDLAAFIKSDAESSNATMSGRSSKEKDENTESSATPIKFTERFST